jgi:hypothetical protein
LAGCYGIHGYGAGLVDENDNLIDPNLGIRPGLNSDDTRNNQVRNSLLNQYPIGSKTQNLINYLESIGAICKYSGALDIHKCAYEKEFHTFEALGFIEFTKWKWKEYYLIKLLSDPLGNIKDLNFEHLYRSKPNYPE